MKDEFSKNFEISALKDKHIGPLLDAIFETLPEKTDKNEPDENRGTPLVNIDSKTYIAELIREKVFLMMGEEIPYTTTVIVDEISPRPKRITYVKARLLTTNDRYKKMLIGREGRKIKEVGSYARKEIELVTNKKVFLDLTVETDPHWQETYF